MEQTPLDPSTLIADRFEIVRAVAPAGAGFLHVALDRTAGRQVSLEVIATDLAKDAAKVSALAHDVKATKTMTAPRLAEIRDVGADAERGIVWIAMDLIEGEGLRARIARGNVSPREVVGIVSKLLDALAPAHQRGQPHRALTPEDVVLVPGADGEDVVVLDFGLGKHVPTPAGSPYVSPEQARASGWVTPAADVFSIGAIAYELICGKPPDAAAPVPIVQAAPTTPASIATIVDKALTGDPGLRYASAKEMKSALDAAIKPAQPVMPTPMSTPAPIGLPSTGTPSAFGGGPAPTPAPLGAPPTPGPFGAPPTPGPFGAPASGPFPMPKQQGLPTPSYASPQQSGIGALPPGVGVAPGPALAPPKQASTTWMWVVGLVVLLGACLVLPILAFAGLIAYGVSQEQEHAYDGDGYHPADDPLLGGGGPYIPPADPADPDSFGGGGGGGLGLADPRYDVPVTAAQPQKGPDDALVTIVEFADYQCPFCGRVSPTIDSLLEQYGNDVRFVWRDQALPFHEHAEPSAELAREAFAERGNAGYWEVHDLLYANQSQLERADLLRYATQAGLNASAARTAINRHTYRSSMDDDSALGNRIGADGTPTFFINGRRVVGAQPREELARVIDEELAHARQLVANGTPRDQVYATVIAGALERYQEPGAAQNDLQDDEGRGGDDEDRVYAVATNPGAPGQGPASAPVVIEEFSDFECPFCKRVLPTVDQVREHYGNRVRVVWRDYPLDFHPHAMMCAEAAREAQAQGGDAKFWRMHALIYAHQEALDRSDLEGYAQQIGLDMQRFRTALDTHVHQPAIQRDRDAADATGAPMGTPTFFVNGHLVQGAQPYDTFQAAVDRELHVGDE